MIVCTNCNVIVQKHTFCSDKCRLQYHRKTTNTIKTDENASVTTADKLLPHSHTQENSVADKPKDTIINQNRCEAPNVSCRMGGDLYEVEFQAEEGLRKKEVYLCPVHARKAKETSESLKKL